MCTCERCKEYKQCVEINEEWTDFKRLCIACKELIEMLYSY